MKFKLKDDAIYELYREFDPIYQWRVVIEKNGVRIWYRLPHEIFAIPVELWRIRQPTEDVANIYGRSTGLFQLEPKAVPYLRPVLEQTERITTNEPTINPGRHRFGRFALEIL